MTNERRGVFGHPGFFAFWIAETVSEFGTYITVIALQVLVVVTLGGTATEVGLLNAARWLPYLLLGLVVGALVDRYRRKPLLVGTDLGRAVLLGVIPGLWMLDRLSLPALMVLVAAFGMLSLVNDSATQSFVPRLVPRTSLLAANARLDQSSSVAQTTGPVLGGALVTALGAPLAVVVDAITYLFSAIVTARVRIEEPPATGRGESLHLGREIAEGLRWVYRHVTLAPFAISTHAWFLCNSVLTTVFVPFVLLSLGLNAFELGVALAAAGVGGLLGALVSTRLGLRWGAGPVVIATRVLMPIGWAVIALVPMGGLPWLTIGMLALGQFLYGIGLGVSNANEMGYRQAVTPDALQARMNGTMRSVNRAMIVIGAPLGGLLADGIGYRPALWIAAGGMLLGAIVLALTPFRRARHGEQPQN